MRAKAFTVLAVAAALAAWDAPRASAQDGGSSGQPAPAKKGFSADQLDQMVGPIALYPDSLLSQILMASTYPLEIVEASRWLDRNPGLSGSTLEDALKSQDWDPSVKSLCAVRDVVKRMNEHLDWTQDLGDAFLGQKPDLMDAIQRMRNKAYDAGNLKTNDQQNVTVQQDKVIVIQSPDPQVIYVPTYYPSVVYGTAWPTPYYPGWYAPPPVGYRPGVTFAAGVTVGAACWGNCHWGWGHGDVNVNVNQYNTYTQKTTNEWNRTTIQNTAATTQWQHDPAHRGGVNYSDAAVANRYGGTRTPTTTSAARGWGSSSGSGSSGSGSSWGGSSAGTRDTQRPAGEGSWGGDRAAATPRESYGGYGGNALSRGGDASFEREASERGAASRGYSGGFSRGGGWRR